MKRMKMHPTNDNDLCFNLKKLFFLLVKHYNKYFNTIEMSYTYFTILLEISTQEHKKIDDISNVLGVDRTTFTRNVTILIDRGYVEVKPAVRKDKRNKNFILTQKGKNTVNEGLNLLEELNKEHPINEDLYFELLRLSKKAIGRLQ